MIVAKKTVAESTNVHTLPASSPPPMRGQEDKDFQAWLDLSNSVVASVDIALRTSTAQHDKINTDLEALDVSHEQTIKALEQELVKARATHESERAVLIRRRELLEQQMERLEQRLSILRQALEMPSP